MASGPSIFLLKLSNYMLAIVFFVESIHYSQCDDDVSYQVKLSHFSEIYVETSILSLIVSDLKSTMLYFILICFS